MISLQYQKYNNRALTPLMSMPIIMEIKNGIVNVINVKLYI